MLGSALTFLRRIAARLRVGPGPGPAPAGDTAAFGRWGEEVAAEFLRREGCRILGRRVRPNRRDEIDIVARDGDAIVFVEVKCRRDDSFGGPAAAVRRDKRHALNRAASAYLRVAGFPEGFYRFDIVEVVAGPAASSSAPVVRRIRNAFPFEPQRRTPQPAQRTVTAPASRPAAAARTMPAATRREGALGFSSRTVRRPAP